MRLSRLLAALGLALSYLVLSPTQAFACSCALSTTDEFVDLADVVVRGTIDDSTVSDPVTYTVSVAETYKGEAAGTLEVLSAASGASCGLEHVRLGESYVVFAEDDGGRLWASLCGGTAPATPALVAEVEAATSPGAETSAPSGVPTAAPAGQAVASARGDGEPPAGRSPWPWLTGIAGVGAVVAYAARRRWL
jgi:hypothetical protein